MGVEDLFKSEKIKSAIIQAQKLKTGGSTRPPDLPITPEIKTLTGIKKVGDPIKHLTGIKKIDPEPEVVEDYGLKIPTMLTDPPIVTGIKGVEAFWKSILGTPEEKTQAVFEGLGAVGIDPGETATQNIMDQLRDPSNQSWATQNYFTFPGIEPVKTDITLPSFNLDLGGAFAGFGNTAILAVAILGGIYILGKSIGR